MHKHLVIAEYGRFIGLSGQRLLVSEGDDVIGEYSLNRLKSVSISKKGVSLSSNIILALAARGIPLFVTDPYGQSTVALNGAQSHAAAQVRLSQYHAADTALGVSISREIVKGKIRNQRAVLLYFNKYRARSGDVDSSLLKEAANRLEVLATSSLNDQLNESGWRQELMGREGAAARIYWSAISESGLLPDTFVGRRGRGAKDTGNAALNYGYSILQRYVWQCLINAGLDIFRGFLHVERPGKPSLVLDCMEEFRPWVVDRAVIKHRSRFDGEGRLSPKSRKALAAEVLGTLQRKYLYHGRRLTLESIIQRQVYRVTAHCSGNKVFRSYHFKW